MLKFWRYILKNTGQNLVRTTLTVLGVGLASFMISPTQLGRNTLDVELRSPLRADAVRKQLLVEAEGTQREILEMIQAIPDAQRDLWAALRDAAATPD